MSRKACRSRAGVLAVWMAVAGCSSPATERSDEKLLKTTESLESGLVARVGGTPIGTSVIAEVARAQRLSPAEARRAAIEDALFAQGAEQRLEREQVRHAKRIASARSLLEHFKRQARRAGRPTDEELETFRRERWWELDRPEMRRVTHVVARVRSDGEAAQGRKIIERIAEAVAGVESAAAFREKAESVASEGVEVRVEDLQPVARDGRAVDPEHPPPPGTSGGRYASEFVDAVYSLEQVGDISDVVKTPFGYHVLFFAERVPPERPTDEVLRRRLAEEIFERRARQKMETLLERLRREAPVEVERAAQDLARRVQVAQ